MWSGSSAKPLSPGDGVGWGFIESVATFGVSLVGLGSITLASSSTTPSHDTWSIHSFLSRFPLSDYRIWIGSAWICLRQYPRIDRIRSSRDLSSSNLPGHDLWQLSSDLAFVGLLLLLRTPSAGGGTDTRSSSRDETLTLDGQEKVATTGPQSVSSVESLSFFRQIESNLGLTPKIHNRRSDVVELPLSNPVPAKGAPHQTATPKAQPQPTQQQRYLELLVHNVSHTDLVLSLDAPPLAESTGITNGAPNNNAYNPVQETPYCLCRPRFSAFADYSRRVFQTLDTDNRDLSSRLISFPRYERSDTNDRKIQLSRSGSSQSFEDNQLPIGFHLDANDALLSVSTQERTDLRIRGKDMGRLGSDTPTKMNAVFFPLLAMLLPQWQAKLEEKYGVLSGSDNSQSTPAAGPANPPRCKNVILLVSGVGSPRNWTHSMDGNSTEQCAKLMELFIRTLYPDWIVVQLHSLTNIFRYDENISFVQNELLPCIQSYRDAHATGLAYPDEISPLGDRHQSTLRNKRVDHLAFDPDWHKTMNVTLSFADGSPARNHAIQAALRPYKPTYFHCWQLKTFWHESKIVDSDIEVHSFEEMETLPPIDLTTARSKTRFQGQQPMALQVVEEMKAFKAEMELILKQGDHDLRSFWLRKTRKPVLAVLAVQMTEDGPVKLYRGTNMEVSMPTGSLCAERNVIGTALADNPTLKRHHLKIIAVLSVPANQSTNDGGLSRPVSMVSLTGEMFSSRSNSLDISDPTTATNTRPPRSQSRSNSGDWLFRDVAPPAISTNGSPTDLAPAYTPPLAPTTKDGYGLPALALEDTAYGKSPSTTPARRISLYQQDTPFTFQDGKNDNGFHGKGNTHAHTTKRKTIVVVQSPEDLNPLRPCGACNEWLKKIAETNPYFQILTFTDRECNGVYCTPVAD